MSFTGFPFYCFAALIALLYYIVPRRFQWLVLLAASLVFYLTYGWTRIPFVVISALVAFVGARKMEMIRQRAENAGEP